MATSTNSQWPQWMRPGVRVFRGPDWKATIRDQSSVELGTLSYVPKQPADNTVNVVWDNGIERNYNSGFKGLYLLRAYDTAQVGIIHLNTRCKECSVSPIRGMMFRCLTCPTPSSLCMACYMDDKHALDHLFSRYDSSQVGVMSSQTILPPRQGSKKLKVVGVFPQAEVIRGPHWKYKNDDGGDTCKGTVLSFVTEKDNVGNGWVRVKWDLNKHVSEYRLGAGGYVDIVAFKTICGRNVYMEHLPLVGIITLKNGDKVTVNLPLSDFKTIQSDQASQIPKGWHDDMKQCLSEIGTVMDLLYDGEVAKVQYENGKLYFIARQALFRKGGFQKDGVVQILNSTKALKTLQDGHGGYNQKMDVIQGQLGRIVDITSDGDMLVLVDDSVFTVSPVCCHPVDDPNEIKKAPKTPTSCSAGAVPKRSALPTNSVTSGLDDDDADEETNISDFGTSLAHAFSSLMRNPDNSDMGPKLFEAMNKGDHPYVKKAIASDPSLVNIKVENRTLLHLACHDGYLDLVDFLLKHGADIQQTDHEGDTALHYAAYGKQPDCLQNLLQNDAEPDVQNQRGLTPLSVAVNHPCIDSVQFLIVYGSDVCIKDSSGNTAMHDAIIQTQSQPILVETVLGSSTADFTIKNSKDFNVLQWAAIKNNRCAVSVVLKTNKTLVAVALEGGFTALHVAAANDFIEITSILLEDGGAVPNCRTTDGMTPLHLAVTQSNKRVIEVLVGQGADVNAQDNKGDTALHMIHKTSLTLSMSSARKTAIERREVNMKIMYFLLEKGADITKPNDEGVTPLDMVQDPKQKEMIKRLITSYKKDPPKSEGGVRLPMHWEQMQVTEVKLVQLDTSKMQHQSEYKDIEKQFAESMPQGQIMNIRRIQNALLWEHYTLKKRLMESKLGQGCANERHLYHGTKPDLVQLIADDNFDFRIAGSRVGALYGDGAYFATTAKYSDLYAIEENGMKIMFVAKVLVGKCTLGAPGLKRPPAYDSSNLKKGLYDATVNNIMSPSIYCVFDKNQYYPEYVIEYS